MFSGINLLGGLFLGWGIGANHAGNMFGTAVGTKCVGYKTAVILVAVFVILGAVLEGPKLYHGYTFAESITLFQAFCCTLAAALVVASATYFGIPVSTSQTAVGGVMGVAIFSAGLAGANWTKLAGWFSCWVLLPLVSGLIAFLSMRIIGPLLNRCMKNRLVLLNSIYKIGLIIFGCYGAYVLGANNVVITTGPFFQAGFFGDTSLNRIALIAAAVGGSSIAVGALTYGQKVMMTVGKRITALDPFSALVAVLAHSIALHIFTQIHVPVSSTEAIVGALTGIGLSKGSTAVNYKILQSIFAAWFLSPFTSALLTIGLLYLFAAR